MQSDACTVMLESIALLRSPHAVITLAGVNVGVILACMLYALAGYWAWRGDVRWRSGTVRRGHDGFTLTITAVIAVATVILVFALLFPQ